MIPAAVWKKVLQNEEFIRKVKDSTAFAQRNIISKRMKLKHTKSEERPPRSSSTKQTGETTADESQTAETKPSKMALLQQQVASVKDIAEEFK